MAVRKAAGMRAQRARKQARRERVQGRKRGAGIAPPIVDSGVQSAIAPISSEASAAQESTLTETGIESGGTTEGPITPPTTYGTDPFANYGLPGGLPNSDGTMSTADMTEPGGGVPETMPAPGRAKPKVTKPKGGSGKLLKRVARTTGTTVGEAKGVMRKARRQVRRGNTAGARKTISRALSGGPRAGVKGSPQRTAKAGVAAKKITKRIATRQAAATPKRTKRK